MKQQKKAPRNPLVVGMILSKKGGPMRTKQDRRSKDARRSWKREEW